MPVLPSPACDAACLWPAPAVLQRRRALEAAQAGGAGEAGGAAGAAGADPQATLPASLTRRYEVVVRPRAKAPAYKLREISATQVGHLVRFKVRQAGGRSLFRVWAAA